MSIFKQTAKPAGEGGNFPIATAGTHSAVLVAIVDLGTKKDRYQDSGKEFTARKVFFCWELEDTDAKEGGPRFFAGADYTLSFGERAKLRQLVENWRGNKFKDGDNFDVDKLLGQPCLLQITHKTTSAGRTVAQIVSAAKLAKGMVKIAPTHPLFISELGDGKTLPEWLPYLYGRPLADHIADCEEMKAASPDGDPATGAPVEVEVGGDADIPF